MAVTVYTPSPAFDDEGINVGINFRILTRLSANSNGQLRVSFQSGSSAADFTAASIGKWDGTTLSASNVRMTTTPFPLLVGGSSLIGNTGGANGIIVTDFVTHTGVTLSSGDWVIVAYFVQSGGGNVGVQKLGTNSTTSTTRFNEVNTNHTNLQNVSGGYFTSGSADQPGDSGGSNFAVCLIETNDSGGGGGAKIISGLAHMGEGSPLGKRSNGLLQPIGKGWVGWKKGLLVPNRRIIRVTHTKKRAA